MEGDSRRTNNRILGAKPPIFPYISPGIPLHVQQPKLLKLFQAGSNNLNNWPAPTQGPGIGAKGADAGRGVGGRNPPRPFKSYFGHPKNPFLLGGGKGGKLAHAEPALDSSVQEHHSQVFRLFKHRDQNPSFDGNPRKG